MTHRLRQHDRLAALLQNAEWQQRSFSARELKQAWQQCWPDENLLPAHHASDQGRQPHCRACRQSGALLEILAGEGAHPRYQRARQARHHSVLPGQHALLAEALARNPHAPVDSPLLWRSQLAELCQAVCQQYAAPSEAEALLASLIRNLPRHSVGGNCRQCQISGPLLERRGHNQYQILSSTSVQPDYPAELPLTLGEVVDFLREQKLWPALADPLLRRFAPPPPPSPVAQPLVLTLWQNPDCKFWQHTLYYYRERVTEPALEIIFATVLPAHLARHGLTRLQPRALLEIWLNWLMGGHHPRRQPYAALHAQLRADLPEPEPLRDTLQWVQMQLSRHGGEARIWGTLPARLHWHFEHPLITPLVCVSSLLSLLWPERFMTLSDPSLKALRLLAAHGIPGLGELPALTRLEPATVLHLQHWARQTCDRFNQRWGQTWLTPRRLDMLLYGCRDHLSETGSTPAALRQRHPRRLASEGRQWLEQLFGPDYSAEWQDFEQGLKALAWHLPAEASEPGAES